VRSKNKRIRSARQGSTLALIVGAFCALAVLGGGIYYFFNKGATGSSFSPILATVAREDFISQILDQAELQSSENVELRCEVEPRNGEVSVIDVVPEGKIVNAGDFLVQLDDKAFEVELEQQKIAVANANIAVIKAKAALAAAEAAKREYLEGVFVESEKEIRNEIFNSRQELEQSQAYLDHSRRLHKRGFISKQQLDGDEISVLRARNALELAEKKLDVLLNITKEKNLIQLQSDIDAARAELSNKQEELEIETQEQRDIEKQIANCRIVVPPGVSGEVVYAKEMDRRGGTEWVLEPGAQVRERQVLIKLPDRSRMEAKALINEQSIASIQPGMPARVKVDALPGKELTGVVTKVNQYAENAGWFSSSVREYAAYIRIIDPPKELIPGMNASVTIQTKYERNVLQAPLQCIYAVNDQQFVLRKNGDSWETVEVQVEADNSQTVWITSGLNEGDQLVMNPGAYREMMDLPEVEIDHRIELPPDTEMPVATTDGGASPGQFGPGSPEGGRGGPPDGDDRRQNRDRRAEGGPGGRDGPGGGFSDMSPEAIVDQSLERLDTNSDGKIDADELKELDESMRSRMEEGDTNGDGEITRDELLDGVRRMMERFREGGGGFGGGG
jgi:multidrug resistance efflux pump